MSFSNPMHHDSNLHPVMQQALAPFAPPYRPLTDEQRRVLDNIDRNIRHFESLVEHYKSDLASRIDAMREARHALLLYFVGELDRSALPWMASEYLTFIPADMLGT